MGDSTKRVDYEINADPAGFIRAMESTAAAAQSASAQIDAQFKKVGDTFANINKLFLGFTAVLAGGGALKKFISDANEWNGTAARMANQLGITTQQASVLNVALTRLGIDSDIYVSASQKLSKQIQGNAQAFEVMGIKVRDATGAYRPVTDLMGEVNAKLVAIKNPIEQNIAGQQMYGKGWAEVRGIMRLTSDAMTEAETRARQLGLIVGPEGAALSKQYTAQMRDLNLVGKSLEVQFGNQLLPVFTRVGAVLGQEVTPIAKVMATVLETLVVLGQNVSFVFTQMAKDIGASAEAFVAMQKWDFAAARSILNNRAADASAARIAVDWASQQVLGQAAGGGRGLVNPKAAAATAPDQGPRYLFGNQGDGAGGAASSRMADWEAQLAQKKVMLERGAMQEGQFREMGKADELRYWQALAGQQRLSLSEKTALTRKTAEVEMAMIRESFEVKVKALQAEAEQYKHNFEARLEIEREIQSKFAAGTKQYEEAHKRIAAIQHQAAEQAKALAQMRVDAERQAQLDTLALEEQTLQQAAQLGLVGAQQQLAQMQAFEQRRFDITYQGLLQRLGIAAVDPDRNPVELARINAQIEALESQHQQRLTQIKGEQIKLLTQPVRDMASAMESGFSAVFAKIGTQIKTLGGLLQGMWQAVGQAVVGVLSKMAADYIVKQLLMKAMGKLFAVGAIGTEAAKAGAGGVASMAAAPFPLNLSAPAFGASMSALAMSFAPLASAAGGFDIPAGLNPVTQLHQREMVLPARHADVIRAMADGAGPSGGASTVQVNIPGMSVGDWAMVHRNDLVKGIDRALKDRFRR